MRNKNAIEENSAFGVMPMASFRVKEVMAQENYCLHVRFVDGTEGQVDMYHLLNGKNPGVFTALQDAAFFQKVFIDLGVVTWPGEIDLAPDAMYFEIKKNGKWVLS
jgi:hypothetical protein